jgi:hypothetical protein
MQNDIARSMSINTFILKIAQKISAKPMIRRTFAQGFLAFLLGSSALAPAFGQSSGGSNYSIFGLGDIIESYGAVFDGVGGAAIGANSPYAVNLANPAAWNAPRSTRFQTGFAFRQFLVNDAQGSVAQNGGYLQGFASVFSIDTVKGISAGFGIVPLSNVQYAYRLTQPSADANLVSSTLYRGLGGMTALYLGAAVQILPNLHLGAMGLYNFGTIEMSALTESSTFLAQSQTIVTDRLSGATGRLGLQFIGIPNLTIGLTAASSLPLEITRATQYKFVSVIRDTTFEEQFSTVLPLELGFGVGYSVGRVALLADVVTKDFTGFEYRRFRDDVSFERSTRVSVGMALSGSSDYSASFLETLGYRFGLGYHQQYVHIGGAGVEEYYGSIGLQIPVAQRVFFDFAATGGLREIPGADGLPREIFGRFTFSVNVGEIWFQPLFRE